MWIFLSYSRRDRTIADGMVTDLEARGFDVLIDRQDLPYGEEWQPQLAAMIRQCDTIVWLASQASVTSRWCNWELGEAQRLSKRLIPVRITPLTPEELPEALGRIHVLPVEGVYEPAGHLDDLINAIETDRGWMETHTRLADRAAEWISRNRASDRLLRGRALRDAEAWRDTRPERAAPPSGDILDLLLQSRRAATRGLRTFVGIAAVGFIAMAGLAVYAVAQADDARQQAELARANESRSLANLADTAIAKGERLDALKLALAAWPRTEASPLPRLESALTAMSNATSLPLLRSMGTGAKIDALAVDSSATKALTLSAGHLQLWDIDTGTELAAWTASGTATHLVWSETANTAVTWSDDGFPAEVWDLTRDQSIKTIPVRDAQFSDDQRTLMLLDYQNGARIVSLETGVVMSPIIKPNGTLAGAKLQAAGTRVMTWTQEGTLDIWDAPTGNLLAKYNAAPGGLAGIWFSTDQSRALAVSHRGHATVWDLEAGRQIAETEDAVAAYFSPNGLHAAYADSESYLHYWNVDTGVSGPPVSHSDDSFSFRNFGETVVTYGYDGYIRVWNGPSGKERFPPLRHDGRVIDCWFSDDGSRLHSASSEGTVRVWDAYAGTLLVSQSMPTGVLTTADTTNATRLVTGSDDGRLRVWDMALGYHRAMAVDTEFVAPIYSADGNRVLAATSDGEIRTYAQDTLEEVLPRMDTKSGYIATIEQSADGSRYLTWSDNSLTIWDAKTRTPLTTVTSAQPSAGRFGASPDLFVSWGGDVVSVWDARNGQLVVPELRAGGIVARAMLISNDQEVFVELPGGHAELWNIETGALIGSHKPPELAEFTAELGPDLATVVTWHPAVNTLYGWNIRTGTRLFEKQVRSAQSLTFSVDGQTLLVPQAVGGIVELDVETGAQIGPAMEDGQQPQKAIYAGNKIVSVGWKGLSVWERESKQRIPLARETARELGSAVFMDSTGSRILTWGFTSARVWDLETGLPLGPEMPSQSGFQQNPGRAELVSSDQNVAELWDIAWPAGNIVDVACALLPKDDGEVNLADIESRYGVRIDESICTPEQLAVAIDWSTIERMPATR